MDELFGEPATMHKSLSKLEIEGEGKVLYVLSTYDGSRLALSVSDGTTSWVGELSQRQLTNMADQVKMSRENYLSETMKALTRENIGLLTFIYSVKHLASGDLELVWKKHLLSDNVRFQLGSVVLRSEKKARVHSELLDYAIDSLSTLQQQIAELSTDKARLINERQIALNRLEKCANIKEEVENDLYSKFKLVLNDKKGKIRRLMEQLDLLSQENSRLKLVRARDPPRESSTSKSDLDTDDEIDDTPLPPVEESLLGDHTHRTSSPPPVKRRKRETGGKVKGQPLQIPRPPSISRGGSSEKRKARSTSSGSDPKQDSLESDELLDLL